MTREALLISMGILAMLMPILGAVVGLFCYKKNGKEIREEMQRQLIEAEQKGGITSLYYKNPGKRTFQKTFGIPMIIGFLIGLAILILLFKLV